MAGRIDLSEPPDLLRTAPESLKPLLAVFSWADAQSVLALDWYLEERRGKSRASRLLRLASIVLAVGGSVLPFVVLATGQPWSTDWGYVALLLAGGCVVVDRAFGLSTSWERFVSAALSIEGALLRTRAIVLTAVSAPSVDISVTADVIAAATMTLLNEVNAAVIDETADWVSEFRVARDEVARRATPN